MCVFVVAAMDVVSVVVVSAIIALANMDLACMT